MTDLRARMRIYDQAPAPDYWSEVEMRASTASGGAAQPDRSARPILLLVAALLAILAISAAVAVGSGVVEVPWLVESPTPSAAESVAPTVSPTTAVVLPDPSPAGPPANGWVGYLDSGAIHLAGPTGEVLELSGTVGGQHHCPAFAPIGNLLAYRSDGTLVIVAVSERGTVEQQLTVPIDPGPSGTPWEFCPKWSPDGRAVAFDLGDGTAPIVQLDGSVRELRLPGVVPSTRWIHDGSSIVAGNWQAVAVVPLDGREPRFVLGTERTSFNSPWDLEVSPVDARIAVLANSCGEVPLTAEETTCVRVFDLDGTLVLEEGRVADHGSITWSPDGTRLAWTDLDGIHVRSIDATKSQVIGFDTEVEGARGEVLVDGSQGLAWSPDGTRLLCEVSSTTAEGHRHAIVSLAADGSGDVVVHSGWRDESSMLANRDLSWQRR